MTTIYESYTTGDDSNFAMWGASRILAQTFTPQTAHILTEVKVKVYRSGSPGTVEMSLKAVDGSGHPTGGDLSTGTFDGDDVGQGSPSAEWVTVDMTDVTLAASTERALLMKAPDGADTNNDINWQVDSNDGAYIRGNTEWTTDGGTNWDAQSDAHDAMFEDRGDALTAPTVTTQVVKDVVGVTATGQGNITALGNTSVTAHGHCWNTSTNPTTSNSKTSNGAASATGAFTSAMTGLTPGTGYYVRAYATNSLGTSYGANVYFVASKDRAGYIWMEGSNFRGFDENAVERKYIHTNDVDDTAVDGATTDPISSNWAYDHAGTAGTTPINLGFRLTSNILQFDNGTVGLRSVWIPTSQKLQYDTSTGQMRYTAV